LRAAQALLILHRLSALRKLLEAGFGKAVGTLGCACALVGRLLTELLASKGFGSAGRKVLERGRIVQFCAVCGTLGALLALCVRLAIELLETVLHVAHDALSGAEARSGGQFALLGAGAHLWHVGGHSGRISHLEKFLGTALGAALALLPQHVLFVTQRSLLALFRQEAAFVEALGTLCAAEAGESSSSLHALLSAHRHHLRHHRAFSVYGGQKNA